ncbi:uncharacterized protein LOC62_04G006474 [Vanrija pseudolonga]|uniref:Extracellular membrane protein CFEM domain-containing protein n=1 Tax=Vanrija pseudolonga TaxID=143232 RepID=A0AAF0YEF1_9TREE|nr:hypothetical protein LOC62_04G006474 [Vanrija pseudolonga]
MYPATALIAAIALSASSVSAFSSGCQDECTAFWALSCPTNDQTCLSTYCSSKSYDLYEGCFACWDANPDVNSKTTEKSLIYEYICNLVDLCNLRKSPIPGPAPSNIGCAGGAGTAAATGASTGGSSAGGGGGGAAVVSSTTAAGSGGAASPSASKKSAAGLAASVGAAVFVGAGIAAAVYA